MSDLEQSFAIFDAVAAVFDKHLTSERWRVDNDDDGAGGWVGPARVALARSLETSTLLRWDGDPTEVEGDFEDLRDFVFWQHMVNHAREEEDVPCGQRGCDCECHYPA